MRNKATIKQRLAAFLTHVDTSQAKFAEKVGLSKGFANNVGNSIRTDKLQKISEAYPELNTSWLITGEGEMLKSDPLTEQEDEVYFVPLLPISAQAGRLNDFAVAVKDTDCEMIVSPVKDADFAMTVSGDSMYPEYPSGAKILIKKINERAFIDWGKTYVLDTCNGSVIKRMFPSDTLDSNRVKCVSINPEYPPFEVNLEDVHGVYRVLMLMAIK